MKEHKKQWYHSRGSAATESKVRSLKKNLIMIQAGSQCFLSEELGYLKNHSLGLNSSFLTKVWNIKKYRFKTQTSLMLFFKCFWLLIYSPNTFYTFHNAYLFYVIWYFMQLVTTCLESIPRTNQKSKIIRQ